MEKHRRSVAKAISWLLTGGPKLAGGIASVEVMTKTVLYYLHERAWSCVGWGRSGHGARKVSPDAPAAAGRPALVQAREAIAEEGT